jgi:hypothetical protein
VWEAALVGAQAHDLNPQNNRVELSELVKLWEHLGEDEAARIAEAEELVALVWKISKVLMSWRQRALS